MRIATIIIRSLLGLLLLFASIAYFLNKMPEQPALGESMKLFNEGLKASIYLLPLAKIVELICGLSYITGRYVALANLVLLPVTLNILLINIFMAPEGIPISLFLFLGNVFLIYKHWNSYKGIFSLR